MIKVGWVTASQLAAVRSLKLRVAQAKLFRAVRESKERQRELSNLERKQLALANKQRAKELALQTWSSGEDDFESLGALHVVHDGRSRVMAGKVDQANTAVSLAVGKRQLALEVVNHAERGKEKGKEVKQLAKLQLLWNSGLQEENLADDLAARKFASSYSHLAI